MIKKILTFLTALSLVTSISVTVVSAAGKDEAATTETTTAPTEELIEDITGDEIVSLEEFLEELGSSSTPQQTTIKPKPTSVTTTTTTAVDPNTEPNGYLVEKVDKYPDERDFITVTTRDGHVFYIVIDYEDVNKKVYFLNTVDTADLKYLLDGNSKVTTTFNVAPENKTTETKAAETTEETKNVKTEKKKNSNTLLYIIGVICVVAFVFIAKKKVSGGKKKIDDDEGDGSDDYTEEEPEIYVNEDNPEVDYEDD